VHDPEGSRYKRGRASQLGKGNEIASSLPLLAMTKGMSPRGSSLNCHCEPRAWQSQKSKTLNPK